MWICLNDAFFSIVDKGNPPGRLTVRARRAGDIERYFPGAGERHTSGTDYPYRAEVPRETVAAVLARAVQDIDYDNCKDSTTDGRLHEAYARVWGDMRRIQDRDR